MNRNHRVPLPLFELFGTSFELDASWVLLGLLVIGSVALRFFPTLAPDVGGGWSWALASAALFGLLGSILLHQMVRAAMARRRRLPLDTISVSVFGGVTRFEHVPRRINDELALSVTGPAASMLVSAACFGLRQLLMQYGAPQQLTAWFLLMAVANTALAALCLLPAFPLDGGRLLRALLWRQSRDIVVATRYACMLSSLLGALCIGGGVYSILYGNLLDGCWQIALGLYIRNISSEAFAEVLRCVLLEQQRQESARSRGWFGPERLQPRLPLRGGEPRGVTYALSGRQRQLTEFPRHMFSMLSRN
jgi:Zn-dependent protease